MMMTTLPMKRKNFVESTPTRTLDEVDWIVIAGQTLYASEPHESRPLSSSSSSSLSSSSMPVARRASSVATTRKSDDTIVVDDDNNDDCDTKCGDSSSSSSGDIDELTDSVASDRALLAKFAPRCVSRSELEIEWTIDEGTPNDQNDGSFERIRRMVDARRLTVRNERYASFAMRVRSYGISRTWSLLRHVYLELDDVEIHSGMTEDDSRQIVYATRDYFGAGRIEGYLSLCRTCTSNFIVDVRRKTDEFFLPFNNCDTIVPFVMQTPTIWFGVLGAVIGTMLSIQTQNFFTFALFVPFIAFCLAAFYNSRSVVDVEDRTECELIRCVHVASAPAATAAIDRTQQR